MFQVNLQNINIIAIVDQWVNEILWELQASQQIDLSAVCEFLNEYQPYLTAIYQQGYEYSGGIQAFVASAQSVLGDKYYDDVIWTPQLAQQFVSCLAINMNLVNNWSIGQMQQEEKNRCQLGIYVNQLINHYARLLFVRVDLSYLNERRASLTPEDFDKHMKRLMEHISNKKGCFKGLQGYAWAIEQGVDKGYHCHLLLMYDGAKRQKDNHIGEEVGKKWIDITGGMGCYWNCNDTDYKSSYEISQKLGIGMIHRNNPMEVQNAIQVARYLVKPEKCEQYLVIKLANMRTFGKGQFNVAWRRGINNHS